MNLKNWPWGKIGAVAAFLVTTGLAGYKWFDAEQKAALNQARLSLIQSETIKNKTITESLEKDKKALEEKRDQDSTNDEQRGLLDWEIDMITDEILKEGKRFRDGIVQMSSEPNTGEDGKWENMDSFKKGTTAEDGKPAIE